MKFKGTQGFTIVELLIVIVVIAILAAISFVGYNGIQNRAKASAAQVSAKQVNTKIAAYAVENADLYPTSLAAINITDSGDTSYQFRSDNTVSPRTFCATVTVQNLSYFVSNTTPNPTAGACPGHSVNGVATITNLVANPSFEANATGWAGYGVAPGTTRSSAQAYSGTQSFRIAPTSNGFNGTQYLVTGLVPGQQYAASFWMYRVAGSGSANVAIEWRNSSNAFVASNASPDINTTLSTWQRLTVTSTAPATADRAYVIARYTGGVANVDVMHVDAFMLTQTPAVVTYADGSSSNWIWNGAQFNSTSTGPPL